MDETIKVLLGHNLVPQLMQVRLSWCFKKKERQDYTFQHKFDEKPLL